MIKIKEQNGILKGHKDELHQMVGFIMYAVIAAMIIGALVVLFVLNVQVPTSPKNF